jgi:hypothetical protein
MLSALHRSLQRLIYQQGHIDQREVEIIFEAPTRERVNRLTRPAICLFLYDIQENLDLRQSNVETTRTTNGRAIQRMPSRRFDLYYMVCALTTNLDDEHLLLWHTLVTLVQNPQISPELMEEKLRTLDPLPVGRIYQPDDLHKPISQWNFFDMPPHPTFGYVVTVPIELHPISEAPLVLLRSTRYTGMQATSDIQEKRHQIGGVVRNEQGAVLAGVRVARVGSTQECITNSEGQFTLHDVPIGTLQLIISSGDADPQMFALEISDGKAVIQPFYTFVVASDASDAKSIH